jgi:galactokinase
VDSTLTFGLVDSVLSKRFGNEACWRCFVPGRLEIFGKHTDYAGGRSLVAAVPRGFSVGVIPASDGSVVVIDALTGEEAEYPVGRLDDTVSEWRRYVATVVRRLHANYPDADLSSRVVFASDLPQAAGVSSSSALIIAIAEALVARSGIEQSEAWTTSVRTLEDRATYFACIENGASFGMLAGDRGVGTHGGSEDHAAILLSAAGELRQFSFCPLRLDRVMAMPPGWTFAVASSGVTAQKSAGARDDYNRLAAAAAAIVSEWRERRPGDARTLGDLVRAERITSQDLSPHLRDRLEHFIAEDARAAEAAESFARGDIETIGRLADASQRDAERLLRNQVAETMDLVAIARAQGAAAASAFGAGWGGSVWALVPEADAEEWLDRWLRAYRARYPQHPSNGFVSAPSAGLLRL